MKVGILSDTHLSPVGDIKPLLDLARGHFANVDLILHAGDVGDLDKLSEVAFPGTPVFAVAGNCDVVFDEPRLPAQRVVEIGRWRVGLVHEWGPQQRIMPLFKNVHAVVYGHSHKPELVRRNGVFYFNPGAIYQPRSATPTAGLMTEENGQLHFTHLQL